MPSGSPVFQLPAPVQTLSAGSVRVSQFGDTGEPILLVHGWCCHQGFWARLVERLMPDHILLTYDLAGHGTRRRSGGGETLAALSTELRGISEFLVADYGLLHYIGHSMGAQIIVGASSGLAPASPLILLDEFRENKEPPDLNEIRQLAAALGEDWHGNFRAICCDTMFDETSDPVLSGQILSEMMSSAEPTAAIPLAVESLMNEDKKFLGSCRFPYVLCNSAYGLESSGKSFADNTHINVIKIAVARQSG